MSFAAAPARRASTEGRLTRSLVTQGKGARLVLRESYFGGMFWLRRKKFVRSYLRLSSTSRSYFAAP